MDIVIGKYIETNSWIHRLDPRTKIIAMFFLIIITFIISSLNYMTIFLGLIIFLVLTSKISITKFLKGIKPLIFILLFTVIFQVYSDKTSNVIATLELYFSIYNLLISIGVFVLYRIIKIFVKRSSILNFITVGLFFGAYFIPFDVEPEFFFLRQTGSETALFLFIRIVSLVMISSLLTMSTKSLDLNAGIEGVLKPLKKIKVPVDEFAMMISISLRFIPTLFEETTKIMKAQSSRGVDFKEAKLTSKITQMISLLVPMFIISLKRSDELANAMIVRGYVPGKDRTRLRVLKYRFIDYLTILFVLSLLVAVIVL